MLPVPDAPASALANRSTSRTHPSPLSLQLHLGNLPYRFATRLGLSKGHSPLRQNSSVRVSEIDGLPIALQSRWSVQPLWEQEHSISGQGNFLRNFSLLPSTRRQVYYVRCRTVSRRSGRYHRLAVRQVFRSGCDCRYRSS